MSAEPQESMPISLVSHTVFCPRRAWLEMNGEKVLSFAIESGHAAHNRVDSATQSRRKEVHSRLIRSSVLGIHGKADVIKEDDEGFHLVEYKATPLRSTPKATHANEIQLALQKLCLEEDGKPVASASVWFTDRHKREFVHLGEDILDEARSYVEQTRAISISPVAPRPLHDDLRCKSCSHREVCLPDEFWSRLHNSRVHAADPSGQTLHLTEQGTRASIRSGRLIVSRKREELSSVPIERIGAVVVHGNIDISSALLRQLFWRSVTIVWCSSTGRAYGWSASTDSPNGLARSRQALLPTEDALAVSRRMIEAKVSNQATLLRRNAKGEVASAVTKLRTAASQVSECRTSRELFGIEGEAATTYFGKFSELFSESALEKYGFEWVGRIGRGADDPLNVLLNYTYGLLTAECIRAILACGLDPHVGVLHSSSRNKPALALDLMEEFRPIIADSVVIGLLNRREFPKSGFDKVGGTLRLSSSGRHAILKAYEKRIQTEIVHPRFGYRVTWRRAIEVQARMLLGYFDSTQLDYQGIVTR